MKRMLRTLLPLVLAAILAVNATAYAEGTGNGGSGEDSGQDGAPSGSPGVFYWDPIARRFRLSLTPADFRMIPDLGNANDSPGDGAAPVAADIDEEVPTAGDGPALSEEALAAAVEVLDGQVVGLDPGHQMRADTDLEAIAPDSPLTKIRQSAGCFGIRSGVPEYRINLLVAKKVAALLESCGATAVMTRASSNVSLSNIERAVLMNESGAAIWIRLHCNASPDPETSAPCVLIPSVRVTPGIYEYSLYLGECLSRSFGAAVGAERVDLVSLENQTGFNWSEIPVVTLEMGYLSNIKNDALLNSDAYQTRCALGIFYGILSYYQGVATTDTAGATPAPEGPDDAGIPAETPEETAAPHPGYGGEQ